VRGKGFRTFLDYHFPQLAFDKRNEDVCRFLALGKEKLETIKFELLKFLGSLDTKGWGVIEDLFFVISTEGRNPYPNY